MRARLFPYFLLGVVSCAPSRDAPRRAPSAEPAPAPRPAALPAPSAVGLAVGVASAAGIAPGPAVSRGRRVAGSSPVRHARPALAVDGDRSTAWEAGKPTPGRPAWLAIDVGPGPTRVLLNWRASGSFNYEETDYGSPGAYRVETSVDSTDGEDGAWTVAVDVPLVRTHGAAHSLAFAGQRWVRMVVTRAPAQSPNGVQIDEIDVHDVSAGAQDTWFFMGDSITAFAFGRSVPRGLGFAERVHERHRGHFPAVVNGGVGGDKSDEGLGHLDAWLAANPDARFWGLGYGTNDAAGEGASTARFEANLRALVGRLLAAGRRPILATIPHATDGNHPEIPRFNAVIGAIQRERSLPPGPDLYAWFLAHPDELRDGLHPDERGIASINRLWAAAVDALYAP